MILAPESNDHAAPRSSGSFSALRSADCAYALGVAAQTIQQSTNAARDHLGLAVA